MPSGNILVVEDSPTERRMLKRLLEEHGYRVAEAADGNEALALIARDRPALLLLDVVLPGPNGYQICRQLKAAADTRDLRIVLVTSKGQAADKFWGMKQGADEYLVKPVAPEDLLASVERQLAAAGGAR
jgi:twitching motility two-component system response regulator PilH